MVASGVEFKPRGTWELLGQSLALYLRHFGTLFGISAVVYLPLAVLSLASLAANVFVLAPALSLLLPGLSFDPPDATALTTSSIAFYCLPGVALIWAITIPLGEGSAAYAVVERLLGRSPGIRSSFGAASKRFLDLWLSRVILDVAVYTLSLIISLSVSFITFVVADWFNQGRPQIVLAALGVAGALIGIAALVGMVILVIFWSFRAQAIIAEGADAVRALRRSASLVKGNVLRTFGRFSLLVLIQGVIVGGIGAAVAGGIVLGSTASPFTGDAVLGSLAAAGVGYAVATVANQLLIPWYANFVTLNYIDLRARKGDLPSTAQAQAPAPTPAPTPTSTPSAQPVALRGWEGVDPDKLSPGQRASYLFERMRIEGESARLLNDLGLAFMEIGDIGGAVDVLRRARALDPTDADIAFNLALAYRQRRDLESARQMMREYFRLETNADDLARVRGLTFLRDILPDQDK
ncbi:MAG: tetratricopeptide repeat protein [Anaerolineae bacterium]|nr:tetratricopeptide repeat protein [Anaerolineae bacterium]